MKIIGLAGDNIIIEATMNEVANLVGAYSKYQIKEAGVGYDYDTLFRVGTDIKISKIYEDMTAIQNIRLSKEYDSARHKLEKMLEVLTPIEDLVKQLQDELKHE